MTRAGTIEETLLPSDEVNQHKLTSKMIMAGSIPIAAVGPALFASAHMFDETSRAVQSGSYGAGTLALVSGIGLFVLSYRASRLLNAYEVALERYRASDISPSE